jgi:integrase/recombinase XerD
MQEGNALSTHSITVQKIDHRGGWQIGIFFAPNKALAQKAKQLQARWSKTFTCWYIAYSKENFQQIKDSFAGCEIKIITGQQPAPVPGKPLPEVNKTNTGQRAKLAETTPPAKPHRAKPPASTVQPLPINPINIPAFEKYLQYMTLKGLSPSTRKTYRNEFGLFLQHIKTVPAESFTTERIKSYLYYCHTVLKLSENTIHSRINAIKLYYEQVLGREKFFWEIPRPKKPLLLPKLLNETELKNLFNALKNKKHKAMLFTAYSAGLRVSEIVKLKIADIDSKRMQIFIQRAKGKKDRYVNLSPVLLDILRNYIIAYRPKPVVYLFESQQSKTSYPTRTVQQIFTNAKNKAGIKKEVGVHSLRHSFATHLLDKGTDIKFIKDLLGHFDIKTTERYLHVSKQQLVNIVSPLDDLVQKETIEW